MHTTSCHHVPRRHCLKWQAPAPAAVPCTPPPCWPRCAQQQCQAKRCHYDVLGLQPTASADDIKSAFRKLALQLHPDVNTAPNATERFKSVKDAYEVLSDPQQRAAYNSQRLQAQTSYTRSSRYTRSSSDTSGVGYVVYDYTDVDETFEEAASAGFWGWYQQSGSWQSSWRSNRKKRKQHWQQQQQQQAQAQQQAKQQASRQQQHTRQQAARQAQQRQARQRQQAQERLRYRHQLQFTTVEKLLSQLDAASLKLVRSLFGQELERLDSSEDLMDVLESLEVLKRQGIDLDEAIFGNPSSSSTHDSSSSSTGWNAKASGGSTGSRGASASSWGCATATSSSSSTRAGGSRASSSAYRSRGGSNSSSSSGRAGSSRPSSSVYGSNTGSNSRRSAASARSGKGPWAGNTKQYSKHLPRFDELSAEELYELINSKTDRKAAKAARAWVQEMLAANRMHPSVAGSLAFLLATDYIMEDIPDPRDFVFGEMFDPDSERYKGRARAGSAYDYVKYSSSSDSSDDDDDDDSDGWVDVDELLSVVDVWSLGDDSDDSDVDL